MTKTIDRPAVSAHEMTELAQLVAMGTAVKPKPLTEAKHKLPDQSSHPVDFTVRIRGIVTKGLGELASNGSAPATVELFTQSHVSEVLRRLKVTPAQLRRALRASTAKNGHAVQYSAEPENAALLAVFQEVAAEVAHTLPAVPWANPGRAAAVRSEVTYEVL